ncbi:CAP domain-containing protein [Solirubrobacter taibaiensis]|nr:CAP domain-containing protein [Solirubrobacter taibaiensis]
MNDAQVRAGLLCLVNNERLARGLAPVVPHSALELAGQRHLVDMAARGYVDHVAPAPAPFGATTHERAAAAGYPGTPRTPDWKVSETLHSASQSFPVTNPDLTTARAAMTGWMSSPSHCSVLLAPELVHLGAAVLRSSDGDGWVKDSFTLVVGAIGNRMTPGAECRPNAGLVAADAVPATPVTDAAPATPEPVEPAPAGLALGTTGVFLASGAAIRLNRGAAAAPMTLQCKRTSGRCRGTLTLRAKGRVLGRAGIDLTTGVSTRLTLPIVRGERKRLKGRRTRAILSVVSAGATSTRVVTLRR